MEPTRDPLDEPMQITMYLPLGLLVRVDMLTSGLARGVKVSRQAILRAAVERGLDAIEAGPTVRAKKLRGCR